MRYASTLWASTRRNGIYTGLNILHLIGVGAARDARLRSESWFNGLDAFLKSLKADEDLVIAARTIEQIAAGAAGSKRAFLEAVQRGGVEVYREPLSQALVWAFRPDTCGTLANAFLIQISGLKHARTSRRTVGRVWVRSLAARRRACRQL